MCMGVLDGLGHLALCARLSGIPHKTTDQPLIGRPKAQVAKGLDEEGPPHTAISAPRPPFRTTPIYGCRIIVLLSRTDPANKKRMMAHRRTTGPFLPRSAVRSHFGLLEARRCGCRTFCYRDSFTFKLGGNTNRESFSAHKKQRQGGRWAAWRWDVQILQGQPEEKQNFKNESLPKCLSEEWRAFPAFDIIGSTSDATQIPYFTAYGTLIGWVRFGNIAPYRIAKRRRRRFCHGAIEVGGSGEMMRRRNLDRIR